VSQLAGWLAAEFAGPEKGVVSQLAGWLAAVFAGPSCMAVSWFSCCPAEQRAVHRAEWAAATGT
jgi:hypothetical protein